MNKLEAIQHHQALVTKRKTIIAMVNQGKAEPKALELIPGLDKEIGRYGNIHNPKIATKAAQYIGL